MEYSSMNCLEIIDMLKYKSNEEKAAIISNPVIKNRFKRELLKEAAIGDAYYNFRNIIDALSLDYVLDVFDYRDVYESFRKLSSKDFVNYDSSALEINKSEIRFNNEYKFFVSLCEIDINKTVLWVLEDDRLFREFFTRTDNFYSMFCNLDYDLVVRVIYKLNEYNDYFNGRGYEFLSCIGKDNQKALLGENFSDDIVLRLIGYFNIDVVSYFFLNDRRSIYLFEKVPNINSYIDSGVKFNDSILASPLFFDKLKSSSFILFRRNVNAVETYNNPIVIEEKVKRYYDELISLYNSQEDMFYEYFEVLCNPLLLRNYYGKDSFVFSSDIKFLFRAHLDYDEDDNMYFKDKDMLVNSLKIESSRKISEVVVDALFCDNIYNVWINIREMIRYNDRLSVNDRVLDEVKVNFYKMILDIDSVSSVDKIKLYNDFKNKNFNLTFYDDIRRLKDVSYDMIKRDLLDLSKHFDKISSLDSEMFGTTVYDMRNSKYTMLVRSKFAHKDKGNRRRNCYSIISDENNDTFGHWEDNDKIIYGYNSFLNDRVIHMLEMDAFSSDIYSDNRDVSNYVNRIATSDEIVLGSSWYSEIELVNIQDSDAKYINMKPDFIVVYDNIRDIDVNESKRLGIPIVIISRTKLDKMKGIDMDFDRDRDKYVNSSYDEDISKKFR